MMSTVIVFGKEDEEARAQETAHDAPGRHHLDDDHARPTTPTDERARGAAEYANGDAAAGKALFASKGCGVCHTLEAAGSTGTVGPNLDEKKPSEALIADRVDQRQGRDAAVQEPADRQADRRPRRVRLRVDALELARSGTAVPCRSLRYHPEAPEKWPSG